MAAYTRRKRHIIRTEYTLYTPVAWDELYKALAGIREELGEENARWGDAATVEARDGELVIWFERETAP